MDHCDISNSLNYACAFRLVVVATKDTNLEGFLVWELRRKGENGTVNFLYFLLYLAYC
jgi:hypothetical protein